MINKIIIFTNHLLLNKTIKFFKNHVIGIVGASIRPDSHLDLKKKADSLEIPFLIQPKSDTYEYGEFIRDISKLKPNLFFINSYSMIFKKDLLEIPNNGVLNIHSSLLPKNRGPNPIQWGIINGDKFAGVTLHLVDEGIDTGPIIDQLKTKININDTWVTLSNKILILMNKLLKKNIQNILKNNWISKPQNEAIATKNFRLNSKFPKINFSSMNDIQIYNLIRAQVKPLNGAYLEKKNEKIFFPNILKIKEIKKLRNTYEKK